MVGLAALPGKSSRGWGDTIKDTYVSALSHEHGIIKTTNDFIQQVNVGDILMILSVYSCLTVNLMKQYHTFDGEVLDTLLIRE